jgi:AraC-like DNA-binding protein
VAYRNPVREGVEIAVTDTEHVRRFMSPRHFVGPQRPEFHQMLLFTSGAGIHTVDLIGFPVSRGTLITVRPGQVQQWDAANWPTAKMLLFHPSFLVRSPAESGEPPLLALSEQWPTRFSLSPSEFVLVERWMDEIKEEVDLAGRSQHSVRLLMHLLQVFLVRLGRFAEVDDEEDEEAEEPAEIYRRFRMSLEDNFRANRSVAEYAALIGYSEKSLYRAVLEGSGLTPKQAIDERVSLEAQRLLLHTSWSVKRVAAELNFTEPTNFVKFFRRTTGQTPTSFRTQKTRAPQDRSDSL